MVKLLLEMLVNIPVPKENPEIPYSKFQEDSAPPGVQVTLEPEFVIFAIDIAVGFKQDCCAIKLFTTIISKKKNTRKRFN